MLINIQQSRFAVSSRNKRQSFSAQDFVIFRPERGTGNGVLSRKKNGEKGGKICYFVNLFCTGIVMN